MTTPTPTPDQAPEPSEPRAEPALSAAWVGSIAQALLVPTDTALCPASAKAIKARLMQRIGAPEAALAAAADAEQSSRNGALLGTVVSIIALISACAC